MLTFDAPGKIRLCDGVTRRDFMKVGSLGAMGVTLADLARANRAGKREKAVIQLFLVGGPSQLETWDPKPNASDDVRGPFRPIRTNVPGIEIGEHFPRMAAIADRYALLRAVHHEEAPIHETGHQMIQTGALFRDGVDRPHIGAVASKLLQPSHEVPTWVAMPKPIGNTGVSVPHGQDAGYLDARYDACWLGADPADPTYRPPASSAVAGVDPARLRSRTELIDQVDAAQRVYDAEADVVASDADKAAYGALFSGRAKAAFDIAREPLAVRDRYGVNTFGQSCLLARRLVEAGVRLVTVNMFDTVFGALSWDMHANGGDLSVTMDDYKNALCPMFDRAYAALLSDLEEHGLLDDVLVVATGEFGRTPKINPRGGRDHWPGVWSMLMAGGGVQGGRVLGASDESAAYPKERPVSPAEVVATMYHSLGLDPTTELPGPDGLSNPLVDASPIHELF